MAEQARAYTAYWAGNYTTSVDHLSEAINIFPTNHVLYSDRSAAYAALSDYPQALIDAQNAIKLKPDWFRGYSRLGAAHIGLHNYKDAVDAYKRAHELDPTNEVVKSHLSVAQSKALNHSMPDFVPAGTAPEIMAAEAKAKGNAAFTAGNYVDAIRHFTEGVNLSPTNHLLYSNRSAAYASLSNFFKALTDAQKTVKLNPDWAKGYYRLGKAYTGLHKFNDAVEELKKALQIEPNNEGIKMSIFEARKGLQIIDALAGVAKERGKAALSEDNYADAIRHFTVAINFSPSNIFIHYYFRSAAYIKLSNYSQALADAV